MSNIEELSQEILEGKGYILIEDLFDPKDILAAREHIISCIEINQNPYILKSNQRTRLYRLINEGEIFEQLVQHPLVISILQNILGEDMTLGGLSAHVLHPGADSMGAHVDYPYFTMTPPYPATPVMEIQAIWMMEDFTETNGAPLFAAGTQKNCDFPKESTFSHIAQKVTGKAGTLVLSHGLCWHDTSPNNSLQPRVSVLANYNPKFIRPLENMTTSVSEAVLNNASPMLKQLLGVNFNSFIMQDVQRLRNHYYQ